MPPSYGGPRLRFGLAYHCLQSHAECAAPAARKGLLYVAMNIRGDFPCRLLCSPDTGDLRLAQGSIAVIPHSGGWPFGALAVWIWLLQSLPIDFPI